MMKSNLIKSVKLTLVMCVFLGVSYVLVLWVFARVAGPNGGNAAVVKLGDRVVGAVHIGQTFTSESFFWGRPSCAGEGYDAIRSSGSNKGASNKEYLSEVEARIDTFLVHHPYLTRGEVAAEMVTASASGLDPQISPKAAYAQVLRVAKARGMSADKLMAIVNAHVEAPFLGLFGPETVNVLKLNVALEKECTLL